MWTKIKVCNWHACKSKNSKYAFQRACNAVNLPEDIWWESENWVSVEYMWCSWHCQEGPFVLIENDWKNIENRYIDASKMWDIMNKYKKKKL